MKKLLKEGGTTLGIWFTGNTQKAKQIFNDKVKNARQGAYTGDWGEFPGLEIKSAPKKFKSQRDALEYIYTNQEKWKAAWAIEWKPNNWVMGGWVSESKVINTQNKINEQNIPVEAKNDIINILKSFNGNSVPDTDIHKIAEKYKLDTSVLEAWIYSLASKYVSEDLIPGGKGDDKPNGNFDPTELKMGVKVEMEHTDDPKKALEIAKDHLTEDPKYYSKLKQAGLADELDENIKEKLRKYIRNEIKKITESNR